MFTTPFHSRRGDRFVNSAFPKKKNSAQKTKDIFILWQKKIKANVCRNSTFQVDRTKNAIGKRRLTSSNRATMSALHRKNDTTNLFGYKLGELTGNNKALPFFSAKKTIQTFTVPFKPLRCCLRSDKLVKGHVWKFWRDLTFAHARYILHIFDAWFDPSIKSHFLMVFFLIL